MKNTSVLSHSFLLLLLCALLVAVNVVATAAETDAGDGLEATPKKIVWAESVAGFRAGSGSFGTNFSDPLAALGKIDSSLVALGNAQIASAPPADPADCEAVLILGFGNNRIIDGEGDDITIYEVQSGGVPEATWVYVGGGSLGANGWRYAGKSSGGADALDIGHVAGAEDYFNYVAICDVPDGNSTTWPAPGPDIDAVAANSSFRLGMVAVAQGSGWRVNLDPMPKLEEFDVEPEDWFTFSCPDDKPLSECQSLLVISARCNGTFTYDYLYAWPLDWYIVSFGELLFEYQREMIDNLAGNCEESIRPTARTVQDPTAVYALREGAMGFSVAEEAYRFELKTPVASLYSEGKNYFNANYDTKVKKTTIWVLSGSLEVDPTAPGEKAIMVEGGQKAIITDDGLQSVNDLAQIFMPVMVRKGN